jgi:sec-independent protein translocase protein TatC
MANRPDQLFDHAMSFGDHLDELRRRILLALAVPLPLAIVIFFLNQWFDDALIRWLLVPVMRELRGNNLPEQLQVLSPTEMIVLQMKLCLIVALVLSAPWVLYQAWKFIEPGLYAHEKRFVHFLLPFSALLTAAGVVILYYVMLPLMLRVLIHFGMIGGGAPATDEAIAKAIDQRPAVRIVSRAPEQGTIGEAYLTWPAMELHVVIADAQSKPVVAQVQRSAVKQEFRLSEYINLVLMLMLAIALAFQMPLVIALLGWLGLATPQWLRKQRRYALMICGVISVVITPPDALSAIIMMVPLYGLYELGILLLVIAPASAVAEGRVFSLRRFKGESADNRREPADRSSQPAKPEQTVARKPVPNQSEQPPADRGEDKP